MSQLYARVFLKILDSSLAEDWKTRHVFEDFLKLADEHGVVDMTREAFSRRTNIPIEVVNDAIGRLEAEDPESRDLNENGRRIKRLDEHRDWGWLIVNWNKYESVRNSADYREQTRERVKRWRERNESPHTPLTQVTTPTPEGNGELLHVTLPNVTDQAFEIYCLYPRKVGKPCAIHAISKALKSIPFEELKEKTQSFSDAVSKWPKDRRQFIPYPSTWFNQERYNDDPSTWEIVRKTKTCEPNI